MRKLLFLLITVCTIAFAADARIVKGKVVSASDNEPLIGATVMPVGQGQGVATDVDGAFTLNVADKVKQIQVSYVGFATKTVNVGDYVLVTLESSDNTLDEVTITVAYGQQKREAKTGAITTVRAEEIKDVPATSVDKMLSGKMAGVSITSSSGQPGSGTSIRIRGASSINASNAPLWVVDGVPVMSGDYSDLTNTNNATAVINPNDIDNITVLKDAAAASVYGSRAANGVILVTTKSGRAGKNTFNVRARFGVSSLANDNDFGVMTGRELLQFQRDAIINAGKNPDDPTGGSVYYRPFELLTRPQTNWMDAFTHNGTMQEYEVSASGGSNKTTYYNSLQYHQNEGVFYGFDYKKFGARVNVNHELSKYLKTGVRFNLNYTQTKDVPTGDLFYANPAYAGLMINPWTPFYDENGNYNTDIPENSNSNPLATAAYDDQSEKAWHMQGNLFLEWTPIRQLTLRTTNAVELRWTDGKRYWSEKSHNYAAGYPILQTTNTHYRSLTTSNTATWQDIYNDVHNLRVLVGQEASHDYGHQYYIKSQGLNPDIPNHSTGTAGAWEAAYADSKTTLLSFLGIVDYNYDSRYFLQLSARYDGSSKFGKNNQYGFFYSVGASWNAHNEEFMKEYRSWLSLAKVRVSYGINGNDGIGSYKQYGTYGPASYNGITGMLPSTAANNDLSWEKNKSFNVGLDFGFWNNRLTGSLDFYTRKTTDMLLSKAQSYTSGFSSILSNVGSMRNTGIELQADVNIIDNKDWQWNVGLNLSHNKTKVLDLGDDDKLTDGVLHIVKGKSLYSYYLLDYYGVNPVNGEALWRAEDGTLTNNVSDAARVYAGSPEPDLTGGINTTVSYKGISLSAVGEIKLGNEILIQENSIFQADGAEMNVNQVKSALNYWKKPGDTNCNPKPIANNTTSSMTANSTRFMEDGSYFRIKDVTLSYTLPSNLIKKAALSNVRVYATAQNLYTFHDVNFWDPERGINGLGLGVYPVTKTFAIGAEVTF